MKTLLIFTVLCSFFFIAILAFSQDRPPAKPMLSIDLPDIPMELKAGEGKEKAGSFCGICHSIDYIPMQPPFSGAQWEAIVNKMIKVFGAPIGERDAKLIINYLAANYGSQK